MNTLTLRQSSLFINRVAPVHMDPSLSAINEDCENGSFQNQAPSASSSRRTASKAASIWADLKKRHRARGNPKAGNEKRWNKRSHAIQTTKPTKRTQSAIAEAAIKEFESLSEFLPDLPDTDARTLALRMYYLELSENVSPCDAQSRVSKMFSISPYTVKRWAAAWEDTGEEALIDHRGFHEGKDKSILFLSPALVTELKLWVQKRLKQGGKHRDGYVTIQQIQLHINDILLTDADIVPEELLDMHEAYFHSRQVSRMTVLRWMHKLGFNWADSSNAPFCDRHEHPDIVTYRTEWVKQMLALKPRLPVFNEVTGRPEWPNLPSGEKPLFHGNHDESILYANEGNRFAWVSNDTYHMKPKGDGATIMVSGVSVPCHGWLGLETIEPKTDGSWNHENVMRNLHNVIDEFESLYPGCQLLLTYDNAPSHVAVRKGALSTSKMNKTDGGKQPILTQIGWYEMFDVASGTMNRVQQEMWYAGPDGTPIAKGALRICRERGLSGIEKMRLNELRALLSSQPDFACLKPELQEEAERRGHILLFGPKCHPECMHVEMCWSHVKHYCRQHCGHSITTLRATLSYALSAQHLTVHHHTSFSDHTWKWIEAYASEADGIVVYETLKALKKIHRHHRKGSYQTVPLPAI